MATVRFLGCGAGYYPALGPTCAYFREGSGLYVMECGASAFERLARVRAFDGAAQITVFLSHRHADHMGSLGILLDYCYDVLGVAPLLVQPDAAVAGLLAQMGVAGAAFRWAADLAEPDENGVSARFFPVTHVPDMPCYGYVIDANGDRFCYSGDANDVPAPALNGLLSGEIDRIYQDTASQASAHHCPIARIVERVPESHRGRVYCVHLDSDCAARLHAAGLKTVSPCPAQAE